MSPIEKTICDGREDAWDSFCYEFIHTVWFAEDREKTLAAMRKLSQRIPNAVLEVFPPIIVFAPSADILGQVLPQFPQLTSAPSGPGPVLLYLSPQLEQLSQAQADFTVAHEFAHVALGHYRPEACISDTEYKTCEDVPNEQAADALAESWGFKRPDQKNQGRCSEF
jgi:hypothetical protein